MRSDQNYPHANVWQRVEVAIEPEPVLAAVSDRLALPAAWPEERRAAWLIGFDKPTAVSS
jgi:hypothetical protein